MREKIQGILMLKKGSDVWVRKSLQFKSSFIRSHELFVRP